METKEKRRLAVAIIASLFVGWLAGSIIEISRGSSARVVSWRVGRVTTRDKAEAGRFVDLFKTKDYRASAKAAIWNGVLHKMTPVTPWPKEMLPSRQSPSSSGYEVVSNQAYAELQRDSYDDMYFEVNSKKK